jgi:EpsI family protein
MKIGDWAGRSLVIRDDVRQMLGNGEFMARYYVRSPQEPGITLFVAYFPSQRTGSTIHTPQNCLPGSGWVPVEKGRLSMLEPDGKVIKVNRYVVANGMDRELVLYWYQAHGRVVASEYWAKFYLVADSIRLDRTDGSLIRVTTAITDAGEGAAQVRAVEFADKILPDLDLFIPR